MVDEDLLAIIDEHRDAIIGELTRYAHIKTRAMRLPRETQADDFVQETLEGAIFGDRNWNQDRYPSALEFLKSVIDSKIYNERHSKRAREGHITDSIDRSAWPALIADSPTQDGVVGTIQDALYDIVGDDEVLFAVLDGRLGGKKRREIAEEWGMSPSEVTNATKRLERKIATEFDLSLLEQ